MISITMCLTVNLVKNYMCTIIDLGVWLEKRKQIVETWKLVRTRE